VRDGVYLNQTGRRIPSLRMRAWSVVRFMPSRAAALWGRRCATRSGEERGGCGGGRLLRELETEEAEVVKEAGEGSAPAAARVADLSSDRGTRSSLPERGHGAFNEIFELADVAGPGIIREGVHASAGTYSTVLLRWRLIFWTK